MNIVDDSGENCRQSSSCFFGENLSAPFSIKLGLIKNFVKGMDQTGRGLEYVKYKFPNVCDAIIKEGIIIGSHIREVMQLKQFDEDLNGTERNA